MECINPANLRWFYILEDIVEMESNEKIKSKLKQCQDSLLKYPLVIHNIDHCQLLRHFDAEIIDKIKARIQLEEQNMLQNLSTIHDVTNEDSFETIPKTNNIDKDEQERKDFELAMKLSQEFDEPIIQINQKPSAAFADSDDEDSDNLLIEKEEIQIVQENVSQINNDLPSTSRKYHDISKSDNFKKEKPIKRNAFADSSDEDEENVPNTG